MRNRAVVLGGSVVGGVLASACCLVPLAFVLLGISGAAFAQRFEPLRPYLLVLTYSLLASAFYLTYRPQREACGPGETCEMPAASRASRIVLWVATVAVLLTTTFPAYSVYLF